jgi:hypothetical protein
MKTFLDLAERVRAEFLEMPGLRLTAPQVQRLCGIEGMVCALVLDSLVKANFLRMKPDGHYVRVTEGTSLRVSAMTMPREVSLGVATASEVAPGRPARVAVTRLPNRGVRRGTGLRTTSSKH